MSKILLRYLMAVVLLVGSAITVSAKDYAIAIASDPDGAEVFLNGQLVGHSTPCVIYVDKKTATKNMIFKFKKEGYEDKSLLVSYSKNQLKANPAVYARLKKEKNPNTLSPNDPSITIAESQQRVDRHNPGTTSMEHSIIRWYFDSDPRGARIYYRVISNVPAEVKNTNETYLTTTPIEETRSFNIPGLTYDNSRNVTVEIKVSKRGYEDQVKRFNVRQALDQQEISGFFEMVETEERQAARQAEKEAKQSE